MNLPHLYQTQAETSVITRFLGLNLSDEIGENEFSHCENLSSRAYPLIAPRKKRQFVHQLKEAQGMIGHDQLFFIDDGRIFYGGVEMDHAPIAQGEKQLVQMGAYIAIFPDKLLFNTQNLSILPMEQRFTSANQVTVTLCKDASGESLSVLPIVSAQAPEEPADGTLWIDTSDTPHILKTWHAQSGMWVSSLQSYVKIGCTGIGQGFAKHDGVSISGLGALDGDYILEGCMDDAIVITAMIDETFQSDCVTVTRTVPDMDFVTQCGNRLWGCSNEKHEIYASKLGDATNWNCFMGLASDSYAMTVGSPGAFTGCCEHMGSVLFFKSDALLRIYGTKPANFQLSTLHARGTAKGSDKSLAIVNETLFYLSHEGVLCCDGGLPVKLGRALSPLRLTSGVGAGFMGKYYLSCEDQNGDAQLYVYDDALCMWHRQDNIRAKHMCVCGDRLYLIDDENKLWCIGGESPYTYEETDEETSVPWLLHSAWIGLQDPFQKHVRRLIIHAHLFAGSAMQVRVRYDNDANWQTLANLTAPTYSAVQIPIRPRRAQRMQLEISGTGDFRIHTIAKMTEQGTELGGMQ